MSPFLNIIWLSILVILAIIIYQDLKFRGISWFYYPILAIIAILQQIVEPSFHWTGILINWGICLVQILLITLVFSIREKRLINITKNWLGWGDILFWLVYAMLLAPIHFLLFHVISMVIALIIAIIVQKAQKKDWVIPLAGLQAIVLLIWIFLMEYLHLPVTLL